MLQLSSISPVSWSLSSEQILADLFLLTDQYNISTDFNVLIIATYLSELLILLLFALHQIEGFNEMVIHYGHL